MFEYIRLNDLRVWATDHNLVSADPIYVYTSATTRIKVAQNSTVYQIDAGSGFVDDPTTVYFTGLLSGEQADVLSALHTLLDPYRPLLYPKRETICIHPNDIKNMIQTLGVRDFKIERTPGMTNVQLYWII